MSRIVRIGVIDSGCSSTAGVLASAGFVLDAGQVRRVPARPDRLGHGSRICAVLRHEAPQARLLVAQVFHDRLATSADQVAAAIDWLLAEGAQLITMSLGLRQPRPVLADACARALRAQVVLCAAVPSIGPTVYPAGFPGVLRVTGDARCAPGELASLQAAHADFGAHVRSLDGRLASAGASMACAHLAGAAARLLALGSAPASLRQRLVAESRYHGMELLPGARSG